MEEEVAIVNMIESWGTLSKYLRSSLHLALSIFFLQVWNIRVLMNSIIPSYCKVFEISALLSMFRFYLEVSFDLLHFLNMLIILATFHCCNRVSDKGNLIKV